MAPMLILAKMKLSINENILIMACRINNEISKIMKENIVMKEEEIELIIVKSIIM
jgi:hypothetical protein